MHILQPHTLLEHLTKDQTLLGLDVGKKTIGLALSDSSYIIASPLKTILRKKFKLDMEELQKAIDQYQVGGLVIGMPYNMNGTEGPRCQSVKDFSKELEKYIDLPYCFYDERLSSFAAEQAMLEADLSRAKRKKNIDKLAASYILQSALDSIKKA